MKQFLEELDERELELLDESLDSDMKYEGSQEIWNKFEAKCKDMNQKKGRNFVRGYKKKKKRKLALVLAAVLALVCGIGVAASYGTWRLPQPETYEGDSVKVKETSSYVWDEKKQAYVDEDGNKAEEALTESSVNNEASAETDPKINTEKLTEAYFINQTEEILKLIGVSDVDVSQITVAYQVDERWNREEVNVSFPLEKENSTTTITFDRETGYLLSVDHFRPEESSGEIMNDGEALEAARSWYEKLPYAQGYEFTNVHKICEDADWMYSFCRTLKVEINGKVIQLKNAYEEVRITIDPKTGNFVCCNVFYVPLLDDHKEGDVPLTEEEARKIADQSGAINDREKRNSDVTAEIEIVHPNYTYTPYGWRPGQESEEEDVQDLRMSSVTRLAWVIQYETQYEEGEEGITLVYVDLYTGEILGGDATK